LVLDPLTYDQAKQLGDAVVNHCYTAHKALRDEMSKIEVDLDLPEQCLVASIAEDVAPTGELRQVRIPSVTINKRHPPDDAASKTKKVAPRQPTLRATFVVLIDAHEKKTRNFLADHYQATLYFGFDDEQKNLYDQVGPDSEDAEMQPALTEADDAGDVLDEPPRRRRTPRRVDKAGHAPPA